MFRYRGDGTYSGVYSGTLIPWSRTRFAKEDKAETEEKISKSGGEDDEDEDDDDSDTMSGSNGDELPITELLPTFNPSVSPSIVPTGMPTVSTTTSTEYLLSLPPSSPPSNRPTIIPTQAPSNFPSSFPSTTVPSQSDLGSVGENLDEIDPDISSGENIFEDEFPVETERNTFSVTELLPFSVSVVGSNDIDTVTEWLESFLKENFDYEDLVQILLRSNGRRAQEEASSMLISYSGNALFSGSSVPVDLYERQKFLLQSLANVQVDGFQVSVVDSEEELVVDSNNSRTLVIASVIIGGSILLACFASLLALQARSSRNDPLRDYDVVSVDESRQQCKKLPSRRYVDPLLLGGVDEMPEQGLVSTESYEKQCGFRANVI